MYYYNKIEQKLKEHFDPISLEIKDQSHLHAGHHEMTGTGETHFLVKLKSAKFDKLSRLQRQRAVLEILKEEMENHIHALSMILKDSTDM